MHEPELLSRVFLRFQDLRTPGLGRDSVDAIMANAVLAQALMLGDDVSQETINEAVSTLEDASRRATRVCGGAHPFTKKVVHDLEVAKGVQARAHLRKH